MAGVRAVVEVQVAVGAVVQEAEAQAVAEPEEEGQAAVAVADRVGRVEVLEGVVGAELAEERVEARVAVAAQCRPIRISTIPRMASRGPSCRLFQLPRPQISRFLLPSR